MNSDIIPVISWRSPTSRWIIRRIELMVALACLPLEIAAQSSNPGRLINLSFRGNAGSTQILMVGYVVGGTGTSGTENLLERGIGPSLAAFGITGILADPTLAIFSGPNQIAFNDNWGHLPATKRRLPPPLRQ